ncbi:MAG: response regulator transcription factor [Solirubrobacteraceae bacterium]|nr:response regulator transcription factor [Solirubrobacteraceae bacterium]
MLVADDRPVFRAAARMLIAATPGFEQVGEASSGVEALALASDLQADVVLLDVRMPGMDGVETARRLALHAPDSMVVLVSMDSARELEPLVAASGAATCIPKQELSPRVLRSVWDARGHGLPA